MATPAHRLIQDQSLNILYSVGATPGGKTEVNKADKRGGHTGRKALNDISNSRKPEVLHSVKKDSSTNVISVEKDPIRAKLSKVAPEKGKVGGGRKALSDLTNSVKPPSKHVPNVGCKLNAVADQNVPSCIMEERFLHNHQECIKAQMKSVDMDFFFKSVGLSNDNSMNPLAKWALPSSSKKHAEMEEMPEQLLEDRVLLQCKKSELSGYCSPACRSPRSPKAPYMSWEDDNFFSDLSVIETPKLV